MASVSDGEGGRWPLSGGGTEKPAVELWTDHTWDSLEGPFPE